MVVNNLKRGATKGEGKNILTGETERGRQRACIGQNSRLLRRNESLGGGKA